MAKESTLKKYTQFIKAHNGRIFDLRDAQHQWGMDVDAKQWIKAGIVMKQARRRYLLKSNDAEQDAKKVLEMLYSSRLAAQDRLRTDCPNDKQPAPVGVESKKEEFLEKVRRAIMSYRWLECALEFDTSKPTHPDFERIEAAIAVLDEAECNAEAAKGWLELHNQDALDARNALHKHLKTEERSLEFI